MPLGNEHVRQLKPLHPRLQSVAMLQRRVQALETQNDGLRRSLDRLSDAVLITGADERIRYANSAAQLLLGEGDALIDRRGRLEARMREENDQLRKRLSALSATPRTRDDGQTVCTRYLKISRLGNAPSLHVAIVRLSDSSSPNSESGCMIWVGQPEPRLPAPEALTAWYRLTPSEARVALALLEGRSLKEMGGEFGISVTTARTHLGAVFAKTDTARQAELTALLARQVP